MKPTTKRIAFVLLSIFFLLASVVVYSSLIKGAYEEVGSLRSKLASERSALEKYQTTSEKIKSLVSEFNELPNLQKQVSLILPKDKDVGYFTNQIVGLSKINGIILGSIITKPLPIQPSKSSAIKNIGGTKAEFKSSGSYAGFTSFLKQLEEDILIIDPVEVKVERPLVNGVPANFLDFSVSANSYFQVK